MRTKILLLLFLIGFSTRGLAQKADEELAAQFLGNKEFEKAADMYEKLLGRNPQSMYFYDNLLKSYLGMNDLNAAQKLVKKQIRKFETNYYYQVDAGYLLKLQNQQDKARETFDNLVKKPGPNDQEIYELAKAFEKRNETGFAIDTYLRGRKIMKNELLFSSDLAMLYDDTRQTQPMIEEYLNVIVLDPGMLDEVQGFLQNSLNTAAQYDLLKQALNKRIRQYPERSSFYEMLIWLHVQKNEYELASIYAKTLDKKNREDGRRLLELGLLATSNGRYDAAISIFRQVQEAGKDKPFYSYARNSEIEARSQKLLAGTYTVEDLKALETEYNSLLAEFGRNASTATTIRNLAYLQAFYMNRYQDAIQNYETAIQMPGVDRILQAQCKLELGDLYLLKDEVWESMLLYGQVDKDFLEEPLGQEAKFRNARLSYYVGEFEWAKAQLDVLKTATTQLISNNAIELSLLIQDNSLDSTQEEALTMYARADLNFNQNNFSKALQVLDSITLLYPGHTLADEICFKKAEIYFKEKNYTKATEYYKKVVDEFGSDIYGDNALYLLAKLYQNQLNNPEEARKLYEKFIETYPGSFFMNDCRKQFRILRGDQLN